MNFCLTFRKASSELPGVDVGRPEQQVTEAGSQWGRCVSPGVGAEAGRQWCRSVSAGVEALGRSTVSGWRYWNQPNHVLFFFREKVVAAVREGKRSE